MAFVESVNGASYAVAYTAALESSLDDTQIIQRYGLLPGNTQIPTDDANIEKGSLIIYVFNTRTDSVIWRSAAQVGVHFDMSDEQRKERVERIVAEMFQTFPVEK
jgi:frataxin-like iron-binding protein CyaY